MQRFSFFLFFLFLSSFPFFISVSAASPALKVESRTAFPGTDSCEVRILADHDEPLEALAVSGSYDARMTLDTISIEETLLGPDGVNAEWFDMKYEEGVYFSAGVLIDLELPFEDRTLPAGTDQHVLSVFFNVPEDLPAGERLAVTLLKEAGDPPVATIFTVEGVSVVPEREDGAITIVVPPSVTSIDPAIGPSAGGTSVTITGSGFTEDTTVTLGGEALTDLSFVDSTILRGTTPPHAAGSVDVVVSNSYGSDTLSDGFTYLDPPVITSVAPRVGAGGVEVTIEGENFTTLEDTVVTFGGGEVAVSSVTPTSITCTFPLCGENMGWVAVTVTTSGGTAVLDEGYECTITFRRADGNCDGKSDIADVFVILNYLFAGGKADCVDALDSNDDGRADISDAVYLLRYLFAGGDPPPAPFEELGTDPTEDSMGCERQCGTP